ncbi:MAG TPA: hypothetical protein VIK52_03685 [Opitutaceae bacterium]
MSGNALAGHVNLIPDLVTTLLEEAAANVLEARAARKFRNRRRIGATLRPGKDTPLWNDLRKAVRASVRKYGDQAKLARVLGLPRQRVNSFLTGGKQMPDAERTLLMLGWLASIRDGRSMS